MFHTALADAGTRRPSKAEMKQLADMRLSDNTPLGSVNGLQYLGINSDGNLSAHVRETLWPFFGCLYSNA